MDNANFPRQKLVLYSYFLSSASWRVRNVLNYKQIEFETRSIDLKNGKQKEEGYKKVNPNFTVPSLLLPTGEIIVETMPISEYIEEIYPQRPLLPKDPIKKAQVRAFCEVINAGIHPYQNLRLLEKVETQFKADRLEFAKYWVHRGMDTIEAMLEKIKGKYCFGDEITLADCFFYAQVNGGINRFGVQINKYPNCAHVLKNLEEIEAFRLAAPKNQPDFVVF